MREWIGADAARFVRAPGADDDKRSRGVVALRTGSARYPGAAVLGVEGAWRIGCGFVRYAGPATDIVLARRPETVIGADAGAHVDAWVIGSGTDGGARVGGSGRGVPTVTAAVPLPGAPRADAGPSAVSARGYDEERALRGILEGEEPVVVDAGALDLVGGGTAPMVITPHAGEFARLRDRLGLQSDVPADDTDRAAQAAEVAELLSCTVLLKGARTLICSPDGETIVVANAPGWLATAGAGDVLGGALGALLAANPAATPAEVAASAVWLHGRAATIAAGAEGGEVGHPIVALEVAEALPFAVAELLA
ncbi:MULTISPECIES: ADP/ATP-dependent (S)-NAD(P)H-hydrate dehydratase [unclassified Microbacterium]|uniref:ADP-dependent NAD(P)H-hydrate dehydratase n=1 Tax=unclassified Microbacterium TaxID=2609290 RepID=UPI0012F79BC8|nr:ADP/ATP-dependent (S)-NAD(P)H-hydrate dehydratase [Microbacterium sp. MAH-37]MVQ41757.1 NAD(P)H-hydrate dehydratase [Microbacterium sp. MAH-37]